MSDSRVLSEVAALRHAIRRDLGITVPFTYLRRVGEAEVTNEPMFREVRLEGVIRRESVTAPDGAYRGGPAYINRTRILLSGPLTETVGGVEQEFTPQLADRVVLDGIGRGAGDDDETLRVYAVEGKVKRNPGGDLYHYELLVE